MLFSILFSIFFVINVFEYSINFPLENNIYVESVIWNSKQWHLIPISQNVTDFSPFFRKEEFQSTDTQNTTGFQTTTDPQNATEFKNSWVLSSEWESVFTGPRSSVCKAVCANAYGGIRSRAGNICKCAYIDDNCCVTEEQCVDNYCAEDERAEGASKEKCKFFPHQNRCYSYKYTSIREIV